MKQEINESVDIRYLIDFNINIFIPEEIDFERVLYWYTDSLEEFFAQTDNINTLDNILNNRTHYWTVGTKTFEDTISILVKRLIASIVLQTKEFSNIIVKRCLEYITKDELKEILNKVTLFASTFDNYRKIYADKLEKKLNLSNTTFNNQASNNISSNVPKFWISTKSPENWRRIIYLDKKNQNGEYTVKIGGAEYTKNSGYNAIPFFDSLRQAEDFIENIKLGKSSTKRPLHYVQSFSFNVVDINNRKYSQSLYKQNLQDYILVKTACGDAYINKNAKCY